MKTSEDKWLVGWEINVPYDVSVNAIYLLSFTEMCGCDILAPASSSETPSPPASAAVQRQASTDIRRCSGLTSSKISAVYIFLSQTKKNISAKGISDVTSYTDYAYRTVN